MFTQKAQTPQTKNTTGSRLVSRASSTYGSSDTLISRPNPVKSGALVWPKCELASQPKLLPDDSTPTTISRPTNIHCRPELPGSRTSRLVLQLLQRVKHGPRHVVVDHVRAEDHLIEQRVIRTQERHVVRVHPSEQRPAKNTMQKLGKLVSVNFYACKYWSFRPQIVQYFCTSENSLALRLLVDVHDVTRQEESHQLLLLRVRAINALLHRSLKHNN